MLEDKLLVLKCRHGDKDAMCRIYEKYKDYLLTLARGLWGPKAETEDIVHDVFVAFAMSAGKFKLTGSLRGSTRSVAWGEVVRNIEASPGFICQMKQVHKNNGARITEFDTITYGSREHGIRMDGYNHGKVTIQTYASLRDEEIISIMHSSKAYTRTPLSGYGLAEMQSFEPKEAVKQDVRLD